LKTSDPYQKIFETFSQFAVVLNHWRAEGQSIVLTNGCFDILHKGHLDFLSSCTKVGDRLVIGLNSDLSILRLKGSSRPICNQETRSLLLASLEMVDAVLIFQEDTPLSLIKQISPKVIVKGEDYKVNTMIGRDHVLSYGGKVLTIPLTKGYSTTQIIDKVRRLKL